MSETQKEMNVVLAIVNEQTEDMIEVIDFLNEYFEEVN